MPTTKTAAPKSALAAKPITPVMEAYVAWIKEQTGYDVDPMSVQLSGILRGEFQKSPGNQSRIAEANARVAAEKVARAQRAAARAEKVAKPEPAKPKSKPESPATDVPKRRRPVKTEAAQ
jgi:sRNA-binding protein